MQRLAEVFQLRRAQRARDAGLTEAQYQVLEEVGSRSFMPSLFARRRESSAAAVSKVLRTLLDAGLVDSVELAVMPVLLGTGIPLLPPGASTKLVLVDQKTLPRSGIVVMSYTVPGASGPAPPIRFVKSKSRASKKKTTPKKTKKPSRRPARLRRRRA